MHLVSLLLHLRLEHPVFLISARKAWSTTDNDLSRSWMIFFDDNVFDSWWGYCFPRFRIQTSDEQYKVAFNDELDAFKTRIRRRAKEKMEEALEETEIEEREKRLGPGGLDPLEVLETLPEAMRKCFEEQDIPQLKKVTMEMETREFKKHMRRYDILHICWANDILHICPLFPLLKEFFIIFHACIFRCIAAGLWVPGPGDNWGQWRWHACE